MAYFVPGRTPFSGFSAARNAGTLASLADWFPSQGAPLARSGNETQERVMLSWVVTFLVIALVAALLGFGGIAGASIEIAKIVFFVALVLFLISAVVGLARGRGNV
jgi:uncharacterized membrane protein YtjA (UPF0391 family)